MNARRTVFAIAAVAALCAPLAAEEENRAILEGLPIRAVTVFKDGHSWVRHEGEVVLDAQGKARLDNLPAPVMGTFWSAGGSDKLKLVSATAGTTKTISEPKDAVDLRGLLRANAGNAVRIVERPAGEGAPPKTWEGKLVARDPESADGDVVLVRRVDATVAVRVDSILSVEFPQDPALTYTVPEDRNRLSLRFEAPTGEMPNTTAAAVSYVQRGLRWIPNYRVTIRPDGKALVELQATVVNDLADLDKVAADFVVGVPSFAFQDQLDPMSLQQQLAQVDAARGRGDRSLGYLSNAIMSQSMAAGRVLYDDANEAAGPAPEVTGGEKNEDLYVYSVANLSLKKGERMTLPVASFEVPAEIVYKLALPYGPPPEVRGYWNSGNHDEFARLAEPATAKSVLRLENTSDMPITTAPALIFNGDRILAQGMTRYTPAGGEMDLEITTAVDIKVRNRDVETGRFPGDYSWRSEKMTRIEMAGEIELTNRRDKPVRIEIRREVLGKVGQADNGGTAVQLGNDWDEDYTTFRERPQWWHWYSWPWWWYANNGNGLFEWKDVTLEPGQSTTLKYDWKYFWAG